jgi:hypothetical protein
MNIQIHANFSLNCIAAAPASRTCIASLLCRYYAPETAQVGYAICGNARYANAYLFPLTAPPAPAVVTLKSVFVSPLSETEPAFLASFSGKCYQRGYGFLGGDPYGSSKYHVQALGKACFAPGAQALLFAAGNGA